MLNFALNFLKKIEFSLAKIKEDLIKCNCLRIETILNFIRLWGF